MDIATDHIVPAYPGPPTDCLPALELISACEFAFPICRPGRPSPCSSTVDDWKVNIDVMGWQDWFWLLEHDTSVRTRECLSPTPLFLSIRLPASLGMQRTLRYFSTDHVHLAGLSPRMDARGI